MVKKSAVPDAWDDDWESQADKAESTVELETEFLKSGREPVKITKAERLAKHAETNRQIWQNAETPETFHFLAARDVVPLKTEFKPALKVLSRKPTPKMVQKFDPITGLAKMALEDDDEEVELKITLTPEQMRLRAQKEREEKQKRYDEVRARIMGTASGASSPGNITPPIEKGKGRGRGKGGNRYEDQHQRPSLSSPSGLFDPNYSPKAAGVMIDKRNGHSSRSGTSMPQLEDGILRTPRGPDPNIKGFNFARRGGKTT